MPGTGKRVAEIGSATRRRALAVAVLWTACAGPADGGSRRRRRDHRSGAVPPDRHLRQGERPADRVPDAADLAREQLPHRGHEPGRRARGRAVHARHRVRARARRSVRSRAGDPRGRPAAAGSPAPLRQSRPCGRRLQWRPDARRELARGQGRAVRRDAGLCRRDHRRERRELVGARQDEGRGGDGEGTGPAVPRPSSPSCAGRGRSSRRRAKDRSRHGACSLPATSRSRSRSPRSGGPAPLTRRSSATASR